MPIASRGGVDLYYEVRGNLGDPPILLVCGLGMQMIAWDVAWFDLLASRGFYVVAYDNRDSGLSTHLLDKGTPDLLALLEGRQANIAYYLTDMAEDAIAIIDDLGLESVHLLGISMGGMIVQEIAIRHPERVRSLCSVMSTTGDATVGQPNDEALEALFSMSGGSREDVIEGSVKAFAVIGSPGYPADEERLRKLAALSYDRDSEPTGIMRQLGAIVASPDRTAALRELRVPTLVVHGTADPLVNPTGGRATADAVPHAKLVMVEGMGHDFPLQLWDELADEICANAGKVDDALLAASPA